MSEPLNQPEQTPVTHPITAITSDIAVGVGLALLFLVILFFAGGGSNFIYIDF